MHARPSFFFRERLRGIQSSRSRPLELQRLIIRALDPVRLGEHGQMLENLPLNR